MIRKLIGIFFLIFGSFCILNFMINLQDIIANFQLLPKITSDELTSWNKWTAVGKSAFWLFNVLMIYWFFKYGIRFMQSRRKKMLEAEQNAAESNA